MKKIKVLLVLAIVSILSSCSSDKSSSGPNQFFNLKYDNQEINIANWTAIKSENAMAVTGSATDGTTISFEFNTNGDIGKVNTYSVSSASFPDSQTQRYYTNESFNFELVALNENDKTAQVNYSGKVFENADDLDSNFKNIEGSFLVKYSAVTPEVSGLQSIALFDGVQWISSIEDQNGGFFSAEDIIINSYNGGEYKLSLTTNHNSTVVGSYDFTPSSSTNSISLSKYNTDINYFQDLSCAGNLTITRKELRVLTTVISGTYSFTATNLQNDDKVIVTEGTFTYVYSNY